MATTTNVDAMSERDLEAAVSIDIDAFVPSQFGAGAEDPRITRERSLRAELARSWAHLRAARDGEGRLVGYMLFWHVVDEVHLLNVAVLASARRQGIGRTLMEDLFRYAREHAVAKILLEVRTSNTPAITLYESLGITRFNVRERYYADGEDALEMAIQLVAKP